MSALLAVTGMLLQTFDAASIKPSSGARVGGEGGNWQKIDRSPIMLTLENTTLSGCIQYAYNLKFYQVDGPDWVNSQHYDVIAKSGSPVSADEHRRMLQALLAERFKLQVHHRSKEMNAYALCQSKASAKLQAS